MSREKKTKTLEILVWMKSFSITGHETQWLDGNILHHMLLKFGFLP